MNHSWLQYSKTCVKRPLSKRPKNGFQDQLSLNSCQKYCRMLQGEQSAILSELSYYMSLRSLFCLFLNGSLRQVLLYTTHFVITFMILKKDKAWYFMWIICLLLIYSKRTVMTHFVMFCLNVYFTPPFKDRIFMVFTLENMDDIRSRCGVVDKPLAL